MAQHSDITAALARELLQREWRCIELGQGGSRLSLVIRLLLIAVGCCGARGLHGQSSQNIVVTGTATPVPVDEADRSISLIPVTRETPLLTSSLPDLLRLDSSLDLQQRAPSGVLTDLTIRGSSFGQILVLLNGIRLNDPQTGHFSMNLPVPLEAVERIEVLKGAGSVFYGSDAVSGVVNVITSPPESRSLRLRSSLGSFGGQQQRVDFGWSRRRWSQRLVGARDFSTGFRDNRDFRSLSASYDLRVHSKLGSSSLLLASADRAFGADQFYGNFPSWERTKTWWGGFRQHFGTGTELTFSLRRSTDLFVLYRERPLTYTNHHIGNSYQASFRRIKPVGVNARISYGAEVIRDTLASTNLGQRLRDRGAVYLVADARAVKRFSFTAGVREERYTGGDRQFNPTIAAGYWIDRGWKLRASLSRAFRLPSFTDLYYRDPANIGDPNLRPERAWSLEGGAQWTSSRRLRLDLTLFQRRESDGIDYIRRWPGDVWLAANFQSLRFSGVETALHLNVWRRHEVAISHTAIRGAQAQLREIVESKYVFNYPRQQTVLSWQGELPLWAITRVRIGRVKRFGRPAYTTIDSFMALNHGTLRPFIQVLNVGGVHYDEIRNVPMPGRSIMGGLELRIW